MDGSAKRTALDGAPRNLPVMFTSFIGRQLELQTLTLRLRHPSTRLLTLTGPGGSGKTRLALEVAAALAEDFPDGTCLVDLSLLGDPMLVPTAMAAALGVMEASGMSVLRRVQEYLREKRLLLVLDNFEHLLEAAPLVSDVLATCPEVKVLTTSRTPLGLYGEHEFPVQPLLVPDLHRTQTCAEIAQTEAVQLFVERAQATRPDFALTDDSAATVAEICVRLDGLPLALELAAARVRLLPPGTLLARLERSLSLLTGGARDRPARQQTLRAAIDWSYELLEPGEQRLFRQLGVFTGGFTLEAVEAVCDSSGAPAFEVLDALEALGRASLVRQAERAADTRFEMLETVREFAAERLDESGEADTLRARHGDYFRALAEMATPLLHGAQQRQWLDRLQREEPNLRAVLDWSLRDRSSERGVRLVVALWWFWLIRSYLSEGRRWAEAAVEASQSVTPVLRANALYCAGILAIFQGDRTQGRAWAEAALALARKVGDDRVAGYALSALGLAAIVDGDAPAARASLEEAVRLFRTTGDLWGLRTVLNGLGELERSTNNFLRAEALYAESLELARQEQDSHGVGLMSMNLAFLALRQAEARFAAQHVARALPVWSELEYRSGVTGALAVLASIATADKRLELAIRLFAAWSEISPKVGRTELEYDRAILEHYLEIARSSVEPAAFKEAWNAGKELSLEQAIELGSRVLTPSADSDPVRAPASSHEPLTLREWEVAQLVARGLTNRQIASELIVTEATAAKHVENIRSKLELSSRTQVAAWVFERTA